MTLFAFNRKTGAKVPFGTVLDDTYTLTGCDMATSEGKSGKVIVQDGSWRRVLYAHIFDLMVVDTEPDIVAVTSEKAQRRARLAQQRSALELQIRQLDDELARLGSDS